MEKRWSSKFGFIMASAGSAVGLGNLWKFPYLAASNGGGAFVLIYIIFAFLIGVPVLLAELAIGRNGRKNAVESCKMISPKWGFAGLMGVICSALVFSFYGVVGGWTLKWLFSSFSSDIFSESFFSVYSAKSFEPIIWQAIFLLICAYIVIKGISDGIEKYSEISVILLIIFLAGLMIYVFTLDNISESIKEFIFPDKNTFKLSKTTLSAMGQMFFSLSLGMGTLITYGSYLSKDTNLISSTFAIVILDTLIAVMAGLVIIPASINLNTGSLNDNPGMIFQTLPQIFSKMKGTKILCLFMFLLILLAAVTSAISLLEVISSFLSDKLKLGKTSSVMITLLICFILGIFASLSFGILSEVKMLGMNIFEFITFLADNIFLPLGGVSICILAGKKWGRENLSNELSLGTGKILSCKMLTFILNVLAPAVIIIITAVNLYEFFS